VEETYVRKAANLVQVTTTTGSTRQSGDLIATEEHPFWVNATNGRSRRLAEPIASGATHTKVYANETATNGATHAGQGWMFAGDLQAGDTLAAPERTETVTVSATKPLHSDTTTVYNFAVEGTHTYFIAPPDTPNQAIWVHNAKKYNVPKEGRYEFPDQKHPDKAPYVGQSGDMPERLPVHERNGRLKPGTEKCTEVPGGTTAREVAEHERVQEITGGQKAKNSDKVSNKKDPIGPNRRGDMGLPEPKD
jgi:hypothetical protein